MLCGDAAAVAAADSQFGDVCRDDRCRPWIPVCVKVVNDIKTASAGLKDLEAIEAKLQKVCAKASTTQEKKMVRALLAPRGIVAYNTFSRRCLRPSAALPAVLLH